MTSSLQDSVMHLRPFVPSKDFEISKRFYLDLGFKIQTDSDDLAEMSLGPHSFLLQAFYDKSWAENCMIHLLVSDLDLWWERIRDAKFDQRYDVKPPSAPRLMEWGLYVCFLHDPAGVLWHIAGAK